MKGVNIMKEAISVIIPAYNEEAGISDVVSQMKQALDKAAIPNEIIVIDDGSSDDTANMARTGGVTVVQHSKNCGYGASLKTGISVAQNEMIVITDADCTYAADQIPIILEHMENADMVVGSRQGEEVLIPLIRRPAKWILRKLAEYITGEKIPDLNSGLRAFRRQVILQYFDILPDRFSFTTTNTVAFLSDNYKVLYIPINYYKRSGKSKIVPWNFIEFLILVVRLSMLFNPLRIFLPISLLTLSVGGLKFVFDVIWAMAEAGGFNFSFITSKVVSSSVLVSWLSGLQIMLIGMVADGINRKIGQSVTPKIKSHTAQTSKVLSSASACSREKTDH